MLYISTIKIYSIEFVSLRLVVIQRASESPTEVKPDDLMV